MAQMMVQLNRPGTMVPWGFRLQGGRDFSSKLSVKKVLPSSPAEGQLCPGDEILGIGNTATQGLTHMEANNIIKRAGNVIQFTIIRGPSLDFSSIKPSGPVKFSPWKNQPSMSNASYLMK